MTEPEQIEGVIFDLDGTLLNTLQDLADSVNYALGKMDMPVRTMQEVKSYVGNGVKRLIELAAPEAAAEEDKQRCLEIFKEHYSRHMLDKTQPYDGISELLKELKRRKIKTAVVSNKFDSAVKELGDLLFPNVFSALIGESENIKRKPSPEGISEAIKQMDTEKSKVIYVGDTAVDVQTAQNAGVPCIGVTWGFRDREELMKAGADFIIDHPSELPMILDNVFKTETANG